MFPEKWLSRNQPHEPTMSRLSQRPLGLLFAAVATLGWALAIGFAWVNASARAAHERELSRAEAVQGELRAELEARARAAGSLAEVERKLAAARADLARIGGARDDAEAVLHAASRDLAASRDEKALTEELAAAAQRQLGDTDRKLAVARTALAALDQAIATRTRELAESRRLAADLAEETAARKTALDDIEARLAATRLESSEWQAGEGRRAERVTLPAELPRP
jgi:zinc resistance-associated protein